MKATLETARIGDSIEARELPGTTIRNGWGEVRTWDGTRVVYVVNDPQGVWIVRRIEEIQEV